MALSIFHYGETFAIENDLEFIRQFTTQRNVCKKKLATR
ncbi:Uncharacterized protein AC499_1107 [Pseudomonas amygdali pv. lachrymans]|uniref:Uncharacterized protein n=1 Tax=Pseudomonas amygdali pv. lachrymans TaxID=53707 RepID=A0ABR5KQH3_PSEAV|nr:Uncharacterized protein AC499_0148 [Pseudomonas amygdali pv. lachrymans]KPC17905.1 Uncharacterized protein AC499_1107 [Pseudomonas amygdali pv. lachrymans]RMT05909.1 hypothetical protein ALP54_102410 [Pseudomonas amygdali pv. lachrymans]